MTMMETTMMETGRLPSLPEPSMSKLRQGFRFMTNPFALLSDVRKNKGDLFVLSLPGLGPVTFLCTVRLLNDLYKKPEEEVVAGEIREKLLGYLIGPQASLSIDGKKYTARRRAMAPYFSGTSPRRRIGYLSVAARASAAAWVWPRSSWRWCWRRSSST